jgi:hypothetical protein
MLRVVAWTIGASLLLGGLAGIPKLMAQSAYNSNVQGTIFDNRGAVIPGAKVTLRNMDLGVEQAATSNGAGIYRFSSVAPGSYQVSVQAPGFAKSVTAVTVTADMTAGVDVKLELATAITQVTVTGQAPALNPEETRTQFTLSSNEMQQLPLENHSTLGILKAAPGVVGILEQTNDITIGEGGGGFGDVEANGRPSSSNLFLLDGLSIMDQGSGYGLPQFTPNTDMLDQVSLQTTNFSVVNGGTSSLQVDYLSKSGTNRIHGDLDYMYSGQSMEAVPTLSTPSPPYRRTWVLGSIGGPIRKDRTFIFGSYENVVNLNSASSAGNTDLNPAFIAWALTAFPNSINLTHTYGNPAFPIDFSRFLNPVYSNTGQDLYGATNLGSGTAGQPGYVAPSGCGTPSTHNIPCSLPTTITGYFNQAPYVKGIQFNGRLDQYFNNAKDRVYLNFFRMDQNSNALAYRDAMEQYSPSQAKYVGAGYTHVFTPTVLNQFNFAFTREWDIFGGGSQQYATVPYENLICCTPFLIFSTFFGPTGDRYQGYAYRDAVSWVHGKHSATFGFQAQHLNYWQDRAGIYSRPFFPFFCCDLLSYFSDPSAGYSLYTISAQTGKWQGQYYGAQVNQFAAYAQDSWKIRPNLTLTYGIRWEDYGNPSNWGRDSSPYADVFLGTGSSFATQISNAYTKLVSNAFNQAEGLNLMPRVGVAWSPSNHKNWNVRGGFGFYEDSMNLSGITANLPTQPPSRLSTYSNTSPANMYGNDPSAPPFGFNYPTFTIKGFDSRGGAIGYSANINGVNPNLVPQKTAIYNVTVERELPDRVVVGVSYLGSKSWDQWFGAGNAAGSNLGWNIVPGQQLNGGSATGMTTEWGDINETMNLLSSNYNALLVTATHQGGHFTWRASYTYARTLGQDALGNALPNPYEYAQDYGPLSIDIPQSLSLSGVYQLPHPAGKVLNALLGGWSLGSMIVAQEGGPFSVYTTSTTFNPGSGQGLGSGSGDFLADGGDTSLPNVAAHTQTKGFTRAQLEYAPLKNGIWGSTASNYSSAFSIPAGYGTTPVEGNEGPNMFRNPGYFSVDGNVNKAIALPWIRGESSKLNFSVECFNLFNRPNLGSINNNFNGSNVGLVTTAFQPRTFELRARFEF